MPIYEYRCLDCQHQFERMQKLSDPPIEQCPACAGKVQKLISLSAFHLKGDGWYVTDYARKGSNGQSSTQSESSDASSSSSSTPSTSTSSDTTAKSTSSSSA